jgi:endonuclease YncB( thermonuclease family)
MNLKRIWQNLSTNPGLRNLSLALLILGFSFLGIENLAPQLIDGGYQILGEKDPSLYTVSEVVDGDTVVVTQLGKTQRVRLIGIDTPEKNHPEKLVQCFAREATAHLESLIQYERVRLVADPEGDNIDRYDRLLRYIYTTNGELINRQMIEDGYAFAYLSFPFSYMEEFADSQNKAREAKRGLWDKCEIEVRGGQAQTNPVAS